jgi:hypothetical protein
MIGVGKDGSGRTRIGEGQRRIRSMSVAGNGGGGGRRQNFRGRGHIVRMAETETCRNATGKKRRGGRVSTRVRAI